MFNKFFTLYSINKYELKMNKIVYFVNILSNYTSYNFVYPIPSHFNLCGGDRFLNNLDHNNVDHAYKKNEVVQAEGKR